MPSADLEKLTEDHAYLRTKLLLLVTTWRAMASTPGTVYNPVYTECADVLESVLRERVRATKWLKEDEHGVS